MVAIIRFWINKDGVRRTSADRLDSEFCGALIEAQATRCSLADSLYYAKHWDVFIYVGF